MQHEKDLAQACASGDRQAWQHFLELYSCKLYIAALALVEDKNLARELADTVCADLYCNSQNPRSKLATYTGRGSLESWLRAVLFQFNIDRHRTERRFTSFDDELYLIERSSALAFDPLVRGHSNFEDSLRESIRALEPEDRFILASHFFDGRNLAQVAQVLHTHASTVGRRLGKALIAIRRGVVRRLSHQGLSSSALAESLDLFATEVSFDLQAELLLGVDLMREGT